MSNLRYALITGASSGIGREFSIALAKKGYTPIIVARRQERLEALAAEIESLCDTKSIIFNYDLTDSGLCKELFKCISDFNVEIVINNAGFGDCGLFVETELNRDLAMIDINVKAMHTIMKYSLSYFKEKGSGKLLNVASSAGLFPSGPYMSTYYATKSYVRSITEAVSVELREAGYNHIYIGALCPGPVDTEFNDIANVKFALKGISSEKCVTYALKGMDKGKIIIIPGAALKLGIFGIRFLPRKLSNKIVGHQQKKKF